MRNLVAAILSLLMTGFNYASTLNAQVLKSDSISVVALPDSEAYFRNGGEKGLYAFLKQNLKQITDTTSGTVYIKFTVDTNGKVVEANALRSLSKQADAECIRVVKLLEFIPANDNGKNVTSELIIPIKFMAGKPR